MLLLAGTAAWPRRSLYGLRRLAQKAAPLVYGLDDVLNGLDLLLFEEWLATLFANPGRGVVHGDMAAVAVNMDRSFASFHGALAMHAVHGFFLHHASHCIVCEIVGQVLSVATSRGTLE